MFSDTPSAAPARPIILNLSEFIDALDALYQGQVIVVFDAEAQSCVLDGVQLLCAFPPLRDYGLVAEFDNPDGFPGLRYYRMTEVGTAFADKALAAWRARAWHERLAMRLLC